MGRMRSLVPLLAVAAILVVAQLQIQSYARPRAIVLSESSALALAEGKTTQQERQSIAEGVKLLHRPPANKAIALAEGDISDEERKAIAEGVKLAHTAPESKAVALAEGKISDEERRSIAKGGIGGVAHGRPESKAVALAEGEISDSEARRIAEGGMWDTDSSPPDSPALALAEDKITEAERQSIARGGYGPGVKKARAPTDERMQKIKTVVHSLKHPKALAATAAETVQKQPELVGTVVDGKLLARGMQVLSRMEKHDHESHNLNPRLVQRDIAPLVRQVLKSDPAPKPMPPAEKSALAKIAASQEAIKERKATMAAEQQVLHTLEQKRAEQAEEARERDTKVKEEVRKALGMSRVEGHGGLDAMSDKKVPLRVAYDTAPHSTALQRAQAAVQHSRRAASLAQPKWAIYVDKASGRPYYFDAASGRASWSYPTQQLRAREYTAEEEAEKAQLRKDRLDADRKQSTLGGFPAFGSHKYVDPRTGVLVSSWPLDIRRMLPAPNLDSSARIQNQRNARSAEEGPNSFTAGAPGKLNALGVNVDGGSLSNFPMMTHEAEDTHKLQDMGVLVDHPPFTGYKAVPYPGFDRTQFDHEKNEARGSFLDRYQVDDDDHRLKDAGVRVYTQMPVLESWAPDNPPSQKYVDGMLDNMYPLKEEAPYRDYIPDALDATPLHLWLKNKIDEGKHKVFH